MWRMYSDGDRDTLYFLENVRSNVWTEAFR